MKTNQKPSFGISRRTFIARATGAISLPIMLGGIPIKAFDGPVLNQLFNTTEESDRVLVLLQLSGGNDGLNTVIPLDQYGTYSSIRSNIAIPESSVLPIDAGAGLHPALGGLMELYNNKHLGIVQGVTYPNPNLSHFRSTDIWMSGSAADVNWSSGWLGRYLNGLYPGYPTGYPNTTMPDPIAIQMSAVVGLTLIGTSQQSMGMALQDPESFYTLVNGTEAPSGDLPETPNAARNVEFVRNIQIKSIAYSEVIKAAADKAQNIAEYPAGNSLADQLKIVARLVAGGLKTRVYVVQLKGFDTHSSQVEDGETTTGIHATLLGQVNDAITAFQKDLVALHADERVVTMSFSEFGRRPASNLSHGTDHGTAAPMFFVGTPVQDGVTGHTPDLQDLDNGNLAMQYDFRALYAAVLTQWFGAEPKVVKDILGQEFASVRVIKDVQASVQDDVHGNGFSLHAITPNPVRGTATISYTVSAYMPVRIDVFDALGFHVRTLVNENQAANRYSFPLDCSSLPSGMYMVQVVGGKEKIAQSMVVLR